jgi:hypothetical protein
MSRDPVYGAVRESELRTNTVLDAFSRISSRTVFLSKLNKKWSRAGRSRPRRTSTSSRTNYLASTPYPNPDPPNAIYTLPNTVLSPSTALMLSRLPIG